MSQKPGLCHHRRQVATGLPSGPFVCSNRAHPVQIHPFTFPHFFVSIYLKNCCQPSTLLFMSAGKVCHSIETLPKTEKDKLRNVPYATTTRATGTCKTDTYTPAQGTAEHATKATATLLIGSHLSQSTLGSRFHVNF